MKKISLLSAYRESQSALRSLSSIAKSTNGDAAWPDLEKLCRDLGFDICGVGVIASPEDLVSIDLTYGTPFYETTFELYTNQNLHLSDPVSQSIARGARFVDSEDALAKAPRALVHGAAKVKQLLYERDYSGHGVVRVEMPGRPHAGWFGFAMNKQQGRTQFRDLTRHHTDLLMLGATAFTSVVLRDRAVSDTVDLITEREAHVLTQLAKGLSPREIAEEEGRSLTTIRAQIASARKRLGARSAAHAVALALELGLILI